MAARMEASLETELTPPQLSHPFYNHPKIHEMRSYGFGNEEQIKQALLVYLDLLEAKHWWNVNAVPCSGLRQILVCGQPGQREPLEVVLPVRQDNELSVCDLQNLLTKVKGEQDCNSLTLALMDSDSSIVYYKITDGFIPPDPPESVQEKKKQRQRKFQQRKSRFVELSRNPDNVRERYFGLGGGGGGGSSGGGGGTISGGGCSGGATNTGSGVTVTADRNQNEGVSVSLGNSGIKDDVMESGFLAANASGCHEQTTTKRLLDDASPEMESHQGAKHRKLGGGGDDGEATGGATATGLNPPPAAAAYRQHQEPQPGPSYGGAGQGAGGVPGGAGRQPAPSRLFQVGPGPGSPDKEDEGVQVAVAMVQAPVVENDSDHDSGMDAGEDDEDEGFDEEL